MSAWWARTWPPLLGVAVVALVGAPAAIASYLHAREVVGRHDEVMAPWLPLSVDGMLLAALVVMWVRRHRREKVGKGPWAAFLFGMAVTIAANLAAVEVPDLEAYIVSLFPPLALGIALELVAVVATRTALQTAEPDPVQTGGLEAVQTGEPDPVRAHVEMVRTAVPDHSDRPALAGPTTPDHPAEPATDHSAPAETAPAGPAETTPTQTTPEPAPDLRFDHPDPLAVEAVRWARELAEPPSQRAVRDRFRVGRDRAVVLLETIKEEMCGSTA